MWKSEIQKMFEQDVREKKRIGSNIYSRTGTRGYTGTIRNPMDLLRGKEKREYKKNGKVVKSNMYETIIPRQEFEALDVATQKNMYTYWYHNYGIKKIQDGMGIGSQTVYDIKAKLGIPNKGAGNKVPRSAPTRSRKGSAATTPKVDPKEIPTGGIVANNLIGDTNVGEGIIFPKHLQQSITLQAPPEPDGMKLKYKGVYKSDQIAKILSKLEIIVSDEESEFYLNIELLEKR